MISLVPLILAAVIALGAVIVRGLHDYRRARRYAVAFSASATLLAFLSLAVVGRIDAAALASVGLEWLPMGMLVVAPVVTCIVAMLSLGLAPAQSHRVKTLSNMLLLFAVALAFLATREPLVLLALWAYSTLITWTEFKAWTSTKKWHRVFALYQGLSTLSFAVGGALMWFEVAPEVSMVALLLAIALREGVVPLHSWFPSFVERAPMGLVVAFTAPQLGIYAQLELLSQTSLGAYAGAVATMGAVTAVAAAAFAVVQKNARRAVAFLMLSQTGLVAFGLESQSPVGLAGALLNWQVLALATSGFAMCLAALEARRGAVEIGRPAGNFSQTPRLGTAFMILGFASVGFPLTLGFVAEDLLVQGTVGEFPILGISLVLATALNGITVLRAFFVLFTGSRVVTGEPDLVLRERLIVGGVVGALLLFGIMPHAIVEYESHGAHVHAERPGSGPFRVSALASSGRHAGPGQADDQSLEDVGARAKTPL